jgi:hypothetical protein
MVWFGALVRVAVAMGVLVARVGVGVGAAPPTALISTKLILLLLAPAALLIVRRPSLAVTVTEASIQRVEADGVPASASAPSALKR